MKRGRKQGFSGHARQQPRATEQDLVGRGLVRTGEREVVEPVTVDVGHDPDVADPSHVLDLQRHRRRGRRAAAVDAQQRDVVERRARGDQIGKSVAVHVTRPNRVAPEEDRLISRQRPVRPHARRQPRRGGRCGQSPRPEIRPPEIHIYLPRFQEARGGDHQVAVAVAVEVLPLPADIEIAAPGSRRPPPHPKRRRSRTSRPSPPRRDRSIASDRRASTPRPRDRESKARTGTFPAVAGLNRGKPALLPTTWLPSQPTWLSRTRSRAPRGSGITAAASSSCPSKRSIWL